MNWGLFLTQSYHVTSEDLEYTVVPQLRCCFGVFSHDLYCCIKIIVAILKKKFILCCKGKKRPMKKANYFQSTAHTFG